MSHSQDINPVGEGDNLVVGGQSIGKEAANDEFQQDAINTNVQNHFLEANQFQNFANFDSFQDKTSNADSQDKENEPKELFKVFADQKRSKSGDRKVTIQSNIKQPPEVQEKIISPVFKPKKIKENNASPEQVLTQQKQNNFQKQVQNKINNEQNNIVESEQNKPGPDSKVNIDNKDNMNNMNNQAVDKSYQKLYKNSSVKIQITDHQNKLIIQKVDSQEVKDQIPEELVSNCKIIQEAERQRISQTYTIFKNYKEAYQKNVQSYTMIINNISTEIISKKSLKKNLHENLLAYFLTCSTINKEFHERSYKIPKEQTSKSSNKYINMKEQFKEGYEGFFYIRKGVADEQKKLQEYINNSIIKGIHQNFDRYNSTFKVAENKFTQIKNKFYKKQKDFQKLVLNVDNIFKKSINGKYKQDIFIWVVKYLKEQKQYRKELINFGQSITELRQSYIVSQKQLFINIQEVINDFKNQSSKLYTTREKFSFVQNYIDIIEQQNKYQLLCTITDLDYVKSVLELQNRKETIHFTNQHFVKYLQLSFLQKLIGDIKDIFRSSIFKTFQIAEKNCFLVHSISGNLIKFNQQLYECMDKFLLENIDAKIISQEGMIQIQQSTRTFIFNQNRSVKLQMIDGDKAEQLIYYLIEKNQMARIEDKKK